MQIYLIENLVNQKKYVGKTQTTALSRLRRHITEARRGSSYAIHCAIRKYGEQSFRVSVLDVATTKEELSKKEQYWIDCLQTTNKTIGYNCTKGGDGLGCALTDETKEKIRKKTLGRSAEQKKRNADAVRAAYLNKVYSAEERESRRQRFLGNSFRKGKCKPKPSISELEQMYLNERMNMQKIAAVWQVVSVGTVWRWLNETGIRKERLK